MTENNLQTADTKKQKQASSNRGAAIAVILISLGILFLLHNLNIVPWNIWTTLWKFWPLVLVLIGIESLAGGGRAANIFVAIIAAFTIFIAVSLSIGGQGWLPDSFVDLVTKQAERITTSETINKTDFPQAESINSEIEIGAGNLTLTDSAKENAVYRYSAVHHQGWENPKLSTRMEGSKLNIKLKTEFTRPVFFSAPGQAVQYKVDLADTLPTDIKIQVGAGKADIDLTQINLNQFRMEVGAGSADIRFQAGGIPKNKMVIGVGAGDIDIYLPEEVGIKAEHSVGVGNLKINNSTVQGGGTFTSSSYAEAEQKLDIKIDIGVGNVDIVTE